MDESAIRLAVREFIATEFMPGQNPAELTDTLSLIDSGILRSLETLRIVAFIEDTYDIDVRPDDLQIANLGTIASIARFVRERRDEEG